MEKYRRVGPMAGVFLLLAGLHQSASAFSVDVVGSFDPNSLTHTNYIYKQFSNQDGSASPSVSLPGNLNAPTDSVAYFGWGIDVTESIITLQKIQSHFWFNGVGSAGGGTPADVGLGQAFSLGTFTYTNEQTVFSGGTVQIDFGMDITIDGISLNNVAYRLEIDNTANSSPNPDDTARLLDPQPLPLAFSQGGIDYQVSFSGFSRDNGSTFETEATLAEGSQTTAEIFATITQVTPVPVPAAVWLFATGFAGLLGMARKRRKIAA